MHKIEKKLKYTSKNNIKVYTVPSSFELLIDSDMKIKKEPLSDTNTIKPYPFTVRQPLVKGICFFTFVETYHHIATELFLNDSKDSEISEMRNLFNKLYIETESTHYMSDYFIMLMIFYFDKLCSENLYYFALCIDYIIGQWRTEYYFFRKEAMMNVTQKNNIIDKIQISYESKDIISDLLEIQIERKHEKAPTNSPIERYKHANFVYFGKEETEDSDFVNNKKEWVRDIIENGKQELFIK